MKYYVTADVHGFYTPLINALKKSGFFEEEDAKKLVILGDLFDRGEETLELQKFVLSLMDQDIVILIKGNHDDLFEELVTKDGGAALRHHNLNGTFRSCLDLTGFNSEQAHNAPADFAAAGRKSPFYQRIIPAMKDYYETESYVFVHGWIPCMPKQDDSFSYISDWREADPELWRRARWYNGMDAVRSCRVENKTVVCGHWHTSYGHAKYEHRGTEFGPDADFSPYMADGIIALDSCAAYTEKLNIIVLEDEEKQTMTAQH